MGRRHHERDGSVRGRPGVRGPDGQGVPGRDRGSGVRSDRRLVCLVLDDPRSVALGNEPVKDGGVVVGRGPSGGLGYSLGLSIVTAVPSELAEPHAADRGGLRRDGRRRGAGRSALRSGRAPSAIRGTPAHHPRHPRNSPGVNVSVRHKGVTRRWHERAGSGSPTGSRVVAAVSLLVPATARTTGLRGEGPQTCHPSSTSSGSLEPFTIGASDRFGRTPFGLPREPRCPRTSRSPTAPRSGRRPCPGRRCSGRG